MVAAPVLRSIGQHLHPVGNLTVANMTLNPSCKLGGATSVTRTNAVLNPNLNAGSGTYWAGRWFGSGGGGTNAIVAGAGFFGGYAWVKTCVTPGGNAQDTGVTVAGIPVVAGKQYTISAYVKASQSMPFECDYVFRDGSGTQISYAQGTAVAASTNTWQRPSVTTVAAPSNAVTMDAICGPYSGANTPWGVGQTLTVSNFLVEAGSTLGSYFDGNTAPFNEFTYAWSGAAGNSTSTQSGASVANFTTANCTFMQDSSVTKYGTYSGRVNVTSTSQLPTIQQTYSVTQLQNYTASLWINIPSGISQGLSLLGYVYASDGTPLTGSDGITPLVLGGPIVGSAATAGFIRTSILMSAPVGAATIVVSIQPTAQPTALDKFYLDAIQFEPYSMANPYVDGDMSGYCWSGAKGTSTTLSTGFPTSFRAFMVGPLAGAQGGMTAKSSMFPGPNVNTLQS